MVVVAGTCRLHGCCAELTRHCPQQCEPPHGGTKPPATVTPCQLASAAHWAHGKRPFMPRAFQHLTASSSPG
eukprot:13871942-Alexandrium_andersonii.AAC.1